MGIGGAGLSSYAQLARDWGAEVGGWDRAETPYLEPLAGIAVEISPDPVVPTGWEVIVSSAYPTVSGTRRADFLAELAGIRNSIVVGGSHGKSTTSAMIAFALHECGDDPAWLVGAPVPQLGSNAGSGAGWLVVEGDESDRTVFSLPAEIAVVTNVELEHHTEFHSLGELEGEFARWTAGVPHVVRDAPPFTGELLVPGEHNRRNAGSALEALVLAGCDRAAAADALSRFSGVGRRFDVTEAGGITIIDDYAHHPTELAANISAARSRYPGRRLRVIFQPHLYSRTRHLAGELGAVLADADDVAVTDVYGARELPIVGVSGKLVVEAVSDHGRLAGWMPTVEDAVAFIGGRAEPGDLILIAGAGDIDRAAALLREQLELRRR